MNEEKGRVKAKTICEQEGRDQAKNKDAEEVSQKARSKYLTAGREKARAKYEKGGREKARLHYAKEGREKARAKYLAGGREKARARYSKERGQKARVEHKEKDSVKARAEYEQKGSSQARVKDEQEGKSMVRAMYQQKGPVPDVTPDLIKALTPPGSAIVQMKSRIRAYQGCHRRIRWIRLRWGGPIANRTEFQALREVLDQLWDWHASTGENAHGRPSDDDIRAALANISSHPSKFAAVEPIPKSRSARGQGGSSSSKCHEELGEDVGPEPLGTDQALAILSGSLKDEMLPGASDESDNLPAAIPPPVIVSQQGGGATRAARTLRAFQNWQGGPTPGCSACLYGAYGRAHSVECRRHRVEYDRLLSSSRIASSSSIECPGIALPSSSSSVRKLGSSASPSGRFEPPAKHYAASKVEK
jgi:hypothetical protein